MTTSEVYNYYKVLEDNRYIEELMEENTGNQSSKVPTLKLEKIMQEGKEISEGSEKILNQCAQGCNNSCLAKMLNMLMIIIDWLNNKIELLAKIMVDYAIEKFICIVRRIEETFEKGILATVLDDVYMNAIYSMTNEVHVNEIDEEDELIMNTGRIINDHMVIDSNGTNIYKYKTKSKKECSGSIKHNDEKKNKVKRQKKIQKKDDNKNKQKEELGANETDEEKITLDAIGEMLKEQLDLPNNINTKLVVDTETVSLRDNMNGVALNICVLFKIQKKYRSLLIKMMPLHVYNLIDETKINSEERMVMKQGCVATLLIIKGGMNEIIKKMIEQMINTTNDNKEIEYLLTKLKSEEMDAEVCNVNINQRGTKYMFRVMARVTRYDKNDIVVIEDIIKPYGMETPISGTIIVIQDVYMLIAKNDDDSKLVAVRLIERN